MPDDNLFDVQKKKGISQENFLDQLQVLKSWEEEWQNMPEFIQGDLKPFKTLYVHFEDEEDMREFAKLIEQKVTNQTKYIWFPKANSKKPSDYRYIDEP